MTDRPIRPVCLRHYVPHSPCLFSLYSSRRIIAKKAAKQAVKGLSNSSKGIRGESCTSTEHWTPVAHIRDSCTGLESWLFSQLLPRGFAKISQSFFSRCLTCRVAKTSLLCPVSICCSFGQRQSGQRDERKNKATKGI